MRLINETPEAHPYHKMDELKRIRINTPIDVIVNLFSQVHKDVMLQMIARYLSISQIDALCEAFSKSKSNFCGTYKVYSYVFKTRYPQGYREYQARHRSDFEERGERMRLSWALRSYELAEFVWAHGPSSVVAFETSVGERIMFTNTMDELDEYEDITGYESVSLFIPNSLFYNRRWFDAVTKVILSKMDKDLVELWTPNFNRLPQTYDAGEFRRIYIPRQSNEDHFMHFMEDIFYAILRFGATFKYAISKRDPRDPALVIQGEIRDCIECKEQTHADPLVCSACTTTAFCGQACFDASGHAAECIGRRVHQRRTSSVSPRKAREILHHGSVHGHPLTDKQRRYFGALSNEK